MGEGRGLSAALPDYRRQAAQAGEGSAIALWQDPHKAEAVDGAPARRLV